MISSDIYTEELRLLTEEIAKIQSGCINAGSDFREKNNLFNKANNDHGEALVDLLIGNKQQQEVDAIFFKREELGLWLDHHEKMIKFANSRVSKLRNQIHHLNIEHKSKELDEKDTSEKEKVMELFGKGIKPNEIVKITGIERTRISDIIFSDDSDDDEE